MIWSMAAEAQQGVPNGFYSCWDEVHPDCAQVCIECSLPVGSDAHWPHEADCGGIEDLLCRCDRPSCADCCTDPRCRS